MIIKEYETLLLTDQTKYVIVYQSEKGQYAFFIGISSTLEGCENLIKEDIGNTNSQRENYAIIPCIENGLRATCIDDLVRKQKFFKDPMEIFDKGWV